MKVVDANVVLRYLLGDHEELSEKARKIIDNHIVEIPMEVLCEVVFVLSGVYGTSREEIFVALSEFFENTACVLPHRDAALKGLELFAKKDLDFVDCILAGYGFVEDAEIYTFDNKLRNLLHRPPNG
jgi:predicted nucleic-acid-binding protein